MMYMHRLSAAKPAAYSGFGVPDVLMHDGAIRFYKEIVFPDISVPDSIIGLKLTKRCRARTSRPCDGSD
jgi:hypothetical protein